MMGTCGSRSGRGYKYIYIPLIPYTDERWPPVDQNYNKLNCFTVTPHLNTQNTAHIECNTNPS